MDHIRKKSVAFTGYRPEKIKISNPAPDMEQWIRGALRVVIAQLYDKGYRRFLSGMADGFDLWAADEVLGLTEKLNGLELVAVVPHKDQPRKYDTSASKLYGDIIARAAEVVVLSEHYYKECYYVRNDYLVRNASLLVCYFDGQAGGTKYTVAKAKKEGLEIINLTNPVLIF